MSVLHVTDFYLPRLGGIELQVHDLARHMVLDGYPAGVVTATAAGRRPDDPAVLPVLRVPDWKWSVRQREQLDRLLAEADVVHCHVSLVSPLAWYAARRAAALGKPVVATMHSMSQSIPGAGLAFGTVFRRLGPVHWTAVSSVAARLLEPIVQRPVEVLPNGVDPSCWHRVVQEAPGPITLTSVMRLAHRKRALPLVRILAEVRARLPEQLPVRAVVAGDGPQRDRVERYAASLGVDLELRGRLDRGQVAHLLAQSHVFLAPATMESFGIAALEARTAGLPVVAMRVGGVGEFVTHEREGLLVGSDAAMAGAVARLVTDTELRQRIRRHNCLNPTNLEWGESVRRAAALYQRLGADPARSAPGGWGERPSRALRPGLE